MAVPTQSFECFKLSNGTYEIRVYNVTATVIGTNTCYEARVLTDIRAYANQNLMVTDLRLLIG